MSPLPVLERYLRLFGMDREKEVKGYEGFTRLTTHLLKFILSDQIYLSLNPSVIAASCLTLAINLGLSSLGGEIGLKKLNVKNLKRVRRGGTFFQSDNWNPDFDPNEEI